MLPEEIKKELQQFYGESDEPINLWFELSYARYLTIPRSVMQAMPLEWQQRMAGCLAELDSTIDWRPKEGRYWVQLKDDKGRFVTDRLSEYRHPLPGTIIFKQYDAVDK